MKPWLTRGGLAAVSVLAASLAVSVGWAADPAGSPLAPAEAGGVWTLESGGHDICTLTLSGRAAGGGYAAQADHACTGIFEGPPAAWRPTPDGMALVDGSGQSLISFGRWSDSLLVSHRSSGVDVQLRRGSGHDAGAVN